MPLTDKLMSDLKNFFHTNQKPVSLKEVEEFWWSLSITERMAAWEQLKVAK